MSRLVEFTVGDKLPPCSEDLIMQNVTSKNPEFAMKLKQEHVDMLTKYLMDLDVEIGSTINSANNEKKVLKNMKSANRILKDIKDMFEIEF